MMNSPLPETALRFKGQHWSLAIFSSREDAACLNETVQAVAASARDGATLTLDVVINGNRALAGEMRARLSTGSWWAHGTTVRLWSLARDDKAHAWNHYLHAFMPDADIAFFMDGYVKVERNALSLMVDAIQSRPRAMAATSMPSTGPSAPGLRRRFLAEGGLHGNLYALTRATTRLLRQTGFRLPTGLYRNDSALGAALAFNFDPARNPWNWDRIAVVPDAEYTLPVVPGRLANLQVHVRRRLRQAKGHLETRALKAHLAGAKRPPSAWPATARQLVLQWANENPAEAQSLAWTDPLAWMTLLRIRRTPEEAVNDPAVECLGRYSRSESAPQRPLALSEH